MFFKDLEIGQKFALSNTGDPEDTSPRVYRKISDLHATRLLQPFHMFSETPIGLLTENEEEDWREIEKAEQQMWEILTGTSAAHTYPESLMKIKEN